RTVEVKDADAWAEKVAKLEDDIEAVLQEEKEERQLASMDMQVRRADNIIVHEAEIKARPKRTWFESEADKRTAKASGNAELNGPDAAIGKKEKKKLSGKEKKKLLDRDDRVGGRSWKKGAAERAGKGALAKAKEAKSAKKAEKREKGRADAKVGTKGRGKR
ncbi:nucleolar DEAD-box protein required for synthesis of 60S ribosomal subunit, partial [Cryomyces antarcticus]